MSAAAPLRLAWTWRRQRRLVQARRRPIDRAADAEARTLALVRRRLAEAPTTERRHVVGALHEEDTPMVPIHPVPIDRMLRRIAGVSGTLALAFGLGACQAPAPALVVLLALCGMVAAGFAVVAGTLGGAS